MAMSDIQRYPWRLFQNKYELDIYVLITSNCLFSLAGSMQKWLAHFFFLRRNEETLKNEHFKIEKVRYLTHFLSDEGFKGTVVNRTLSSLNYGSFEITLTVPLCVRNHFSTNPSIQDGECTCLQRAPECASLSDTGWPGE